MAASEHNSGTGGTLFSRVLELIARAFVGTGRFFKGLFSGSRLSMPSESHDQKSGLGKIRRTGSGIADSTASGERADYQRRHRAASASRSITSVSSASRGRKRMIDGINEGQFLKWLTIGAFSLLGVVGIVLIIAAVGSGGSAIELTDLSSSAKPPIVMSESDARVTISLGGTVKLQGEVLEAAKNSDGYDFNNYLSEIKSVLKADISIASIVGHVDGLGGNSGISGYPAANYPLELAQTLSSIGVTHAVTANNNALYSGWNAMVGTRKALAESGITPLGTYESAETSASVYVTEAGGIKVGIGAYNCLSEDDYDTLISAQTRAGVSEEQRGYGVKQLVITKAAKPILADVEAMRTAGAEVIIVCLSWGSESRQEPVYDMRSLAQDLIDDGVNIIYGTGSDYAQQITKKQSKKTKKNCYVFYSMGNLFSDVKSGADKLTQQSIAASFTFERKAGESEVSVTAAVCHPVFCNRDSSYADKSTYLKYRVVPAAKYASSASRPEIFSGDSQWQKCKSAYSRIKSLASGKLTIGAPSSFVSSQTEGANQGAEQSGRI